MPKKAWVIGTDGVVDWYENNRQTPYYSIWHGNRMLFSYYKDDEAKGLELLKENLETAEENGVCEILTLKLHSLIDQKKLITDKTPYIASLDFSPCMPENTNKVIGKAPAGYERMNYHEKQNEIINMLKVIKDSQDEKIKSLESRLTAIEEEEIEDIQPGSKLIGYLGELIQSPKIQDVIIGAISKFLLPQKTVIAGMETTNIENSNTVMSDQDKLNIAISTIAQHDPDYINDLYRLSQIAVNKPETFKFLLSSLRNL